jgi:RES domain-containing protein
MKVFRLSRKKYAKDLSGKGAAFFGNRWNSKGVEVLYTAESRALAMAEVLVHISLSSLPDDYMMVEIEIPDTLNVEILNLKSLGKNWNANPLNPKTQKLGDAFIHSQKNCVLKVPSAVVKGDFNYLLNPNHLEISKVKISDVTDFPFDSRVFK